MYLLYLVYDEVTFIAQNSRCVSVLFGQQVEPLCYSIHHGQNNGPQEAQDIKDPLDSFAMTCIKSKHIHTRAHIHTECKEMVVLNKKHIYYVLYI